MGDSTQGARIGLGLRDNNQVKDFGVFSGKLAKLGKRKERKIERLVVKPKPQKKKRFLCLADEEDRKDPQTMYEYVDDIMKDLFESENENLPAEDYMTKQTEIDDEMRSILIGWLIEVHHKFKLKSETLFLTINLLDRYLEKAIVSTDDLQLIGCTCMLIASKYEEIYAPELNDFVFISDKAFIAEDLLECERKICTALNFTFSVPTPIHFARRFIKVVGSDVLFSNLVYYILELGFLNSKLVHEKPSKVAASAVYLALKMRIGTRWNEEFQHQTSYSSQQLRAIVHKLYEPIKKPSRIGAAVRTKYASTTYKKVSKVYS